MNNNYSISLISESNFAELFYIIFYIGGKKYAVNISYAAEIINLPEIEIPETAPAGIIGMFNYKGSVIKAVDLCPFLGFEPEKFSLSGKMIVLNTDGIYFAVYTGSIGSIASFEPENLQNMPYSSGDSILSQVYKSDSGNINIIDCAILNDFVSKRTAERGNVNYQALFPSDEKSKQILKLRTRHRNETENSFIEQEKIQYSDQYILFTMDNQNYYLNIKHVKEFVPAKRLKITELPCAPDYIAGITGIKGGFLTVINLKRFMFPEIKSSTECSKLIIVSGKNFDTAFLVDDIKCIKSLNNIQQSKMYAGSRNYIYAEFMENNTLCSIINFKQIINDDRLYINIE